MVNTIAGTERPATHVRAADSSILPFVDLGREACCSLDAACHCEWLVPNGIGGFASGTIAGVSTRRYHGWLVAAFKPPLGRTLLVAKLEEKAEYDGGEYTLFVDRWAHGTVNPDSHKRLERFRLEGTTPVWTFVCSDARLENLGRSS